MPDIPMKYKLIFIGTSEFGIPSLKALIDDERFEVQAVFTQPDRKVGRKQELQFSPIKELALEHKLPIHQPEDINSAESLTIMKDLEPDYLIVISFGQILSQALLDIPKIAPINVHASLLPQYRGASPMQESLKNGDEVTGTTIQQMVYKLDAGDILAQEEHSIDPHDTFLTLQERLSQASATLLLEVLARELSPLPQDESNVSYCTKISKTDGEIEWQEESATDIERKLRAFTPWPGIYSFMNGKRLKILEAEVADLPSSELPGTVTALDDGVGIVCMKEILLLKRIQLEGKQDMTMEEFMRGRDDLIGTKLGQG